MKYPFSTTAVALPMDITSVVAEFIARRHDITNDS